MNPFIVVLFLKNFLLISAKWLLGIKYVNYTNSILTFFKKVYVLNWMEKFVFHFRYVIICIFIIGLHIYSCLSLYITMFHTLIK